MTSYAQQEVVEIKRLGGNLRAFIRDAENKRHYTAATHAFLRYADRVIMEIRGYVNGLEPVSGKSSYLANATKRDLLAIKKFLGLLHRYVKTALDADTLSIPEPFARVLDAVAKTQDPAAQVLVTVTDEFNYLQHPTAEIVDLDSGGIFERFPPSLGLVSLPYSEGKDALHNTLLFHELGHYFYQHFDVGSAITPLRGDLLGELATVPKTVPPELPEPLLRQLSWQMINSWAQELYCDGFATVATGPSFLCSYWLLLSALPETKGIGNAFSMTHPPDNLRLDAMSKLLRGRSLYDIVEREMPNIHEWLQKRSSEATSGWTVPQEIDFGKEVGKLLIRFFTERVVPAIAGVIEALSGDIVFDREEWEHHHAAICTSLTHVVVPSEVDRDRTTLVSRGVLRAPTILLSAFVFYLQDCPGWTAGGGSSLLDRVNGLVLKAFDDILLVRGFHG